MDRHLKLPSIVALEQPSGNVMARSSTLKISVIIPVHKPGAPFEACLSSLMKLEPPPEEIVVVADGDRESAQQAEAAGMRSIVTPEPGGPLLFTLPN